MPGQGRHSGELETREGGSRVAKRGHDRRDLSHDAYPPGELAQELPTPRHFEQASSLVTEEMMAVPCGSDPEEHLESIRQYVEAGFDEIYVQQIGPEQEGFFRFYESEILPKLR
jgi:hypothetical protein